MKKVTNTWSLFLGALLLMSLSQCQTAVGNSGELTWYSWEDALKANAKKPKKILVDVYTDWCGWCKKMDQLTFTDPAVVRYLNEHFYVVKFDAEQQGAIQFRGNTYQYQANQGRRGVHELAVALLEGRMSYPSIVYLNERFERITVSPGYKTPEAIMPELQFVGESHYTSKSFEQFSSGR
jgi:thioredoxin-related protein